MQILYLYLLGILTSDIKNIMQMSEKGTNNEELMNNLDNSLVYGGVRRISDEELELLNQLDENFDSIIKMQNELNVTKKSLKNTETLLNRTDEAINENCSEITRLKILVARGWQLGLSDGIDKETVIKSLSDKQLIEELKEQIESKNGESLLTDAIKTTEANVRTSSINEQLRTIQDISKSNNNIQKDSETNEKMFEA